MRDVRHKSAIQNPANINKDRRTHKHVHHRGLMGGISQVRDFTTNDERQPPQIEKCRELEHDGTMCVKYMLLLCVVLCNMFMNEIVVRT